MKTSVIIPTLNRKDFLFRAVNSVINQTKPINEIIVVDNGSTDGTEQMLAKYFPFVRYFFEAKEGVSRARNMGISQAKNPWIGLLDSDDEWAKNKVERISEIYSKSKSKELIWHSDEIWIRNGKLLNQKGHHRRRGGYIFENCLKMCCISPSSAILHKSIFDRYGYFDENLEVCEDYDFWIRVSSREKIGFIAEKLVIKYGGHEGQLSKRFWGMDRFRIDSLVKILDDNLLSKEHEGMLIAAIIKKLKIVVSGAKKRKNLGIIKKYGSIMERFLN